MSWSNEPRGLLTGSVETRADGSRRTVEVIYDGSRPVGTKASPWTETIR